MNVPAFYQATRIGVWNLDEFLEKGDLSPIFTTRLGIGVHILQAFVDGDVQPGMRVGVERSPSWAATTPANLIRRVLTRVPAISVGRTNLT